MQSYTAQKFTLPVKCAIAKQKQYVFIADD